MDGGWGAPSSFLCSGGARRLAWAPASGGLPSLPEPGGDFPAGRLRSLSMLRPSPPPGWLWTPLPGLASSLSWPPVRLAWPPALKQSFPSACPGSSASLPPCSLVQAGRGSFPASRRPVQHAPLPDLTPSESSPPPPRGSPSQAWLPPCAPPPASLRTPHTGQGHLSAPLNSPSINGNCQHDFHSLK